LDKYVKGMNQTFVYWEHLKRSGTGQNTYSDPIEIKGRKEDESEVVRTRDGREIVSKAKIFVDRKLKLNSYLYEGLLTDITGEAPENVDEAYEVMISGASPNLSGTVELLWVVI